jgi:hypothetical protein
MSARALAALGASLAVAVAIAIVLTRHHEQAAPPAPPTTVTTTAPPPTTTAPPPPPTTTTTTAPPPKPPPAAVPMSWDNAGAIVWHSTDVDPTWLGQTLREDGFGWVAVYLPPDPNWMYRFRLASGLPIGGWSVLGNDPGYEADLAARLVKKYDLAFYIADAEQPYADVPSRSSTFVRVFRRDEPDLPAGLSSLCTANALDLSAWAGADFAFLPQAYVNDFGAGVDPINCANTAQAIFGRANVHPTVASYAGKFGTVAPARFAHLLAQAGTKGFSVYPAEVAMSSEDWHAYGQAIASLHIATQVR